MKNYVYPCKPQFTKKWSLRGSILYRHVFMMCSLSVILLVPRDCGISWVSSLIFELCFKSVSIYARHCSSDHSQIAECRKKSK